MAAEKCKKCKFFKEAISPTGEPDKVPPNTVGECHRNPPSSSRGRRPLVQIDEWCGEYAVKE